MWQTRLMYLCEAAGTPRRSETAPAMPLETIAKVMDAGGGRRIRRGCPVAGAFHPPRGIRGFPGMASRIDMISARTGCLRETKSRSSMAMAVRTITCRTGEFCPGKSFHCVDPRAIEEDRDCLRAGPTCPRMFRPRFHNPTRDGATQRHKCGRAPWWTGTRRKNITTFFF